MWRNLEDALRLGRSILEVCRFESCHRHLVFVHAIMTAWVPNIRKKYWQKQRRIALLLWVLSDILVFAKQEEHTAISLGC